MAEFNGHVNVRVGEQIAAWIADRAERAGNPSPSQQARDDLALLCGLFRAELGRIELTTGEASAVADVLNPPLMDLGGPTFGRVTFMEMAGAIGDARESGGEMSSYGAKHGFDEEELLGKLRRLGPAADYALRDAISRWWQGNLDATADGFAAVGLRIVGE